ncbi:aconitase X catalytic domain-containing protein [Thermopolyspora sp. NPDC052614]|uniref:aconitase X catalytic domain-containing protein n=1 Tax=Thermopolyspora sp. NPDC052614 TaxID=3155682 RepID=UPI003432611A
MLTETGTTPPEPASARPYRPGGTVRLTDVERDMAEGGQGEAVAAAMDLLIRYGDILGAERLVETDNVCGANIFGPRHSRSYGNADPVALFSEFSLDSPTPLDVPPMRANSCQLIGPYDPVHADLQGLDGATLEEITQSERYLASLGVSLLNTCTPYQVGNVPTRGEHCAWMESSAVPYINSLLGARTNTEGRESTAAAMVTGRIPYAGLHLTENRYATHLVRIDTPVVSTFDWSVFGYFLGRHLRHEIPVIADVAGSVDPVSLKQFGAAANSSGDVEMYHIPGVTAEAVSVEHALHGRPPVEELRFTRRDYEDVIEHLNSTATGDDIQFVMIGCPHSSLSQLLEVTGLLDGRRISDSVHLWVYTPSALREVARRNGWIDIIERAGGKVWADTCPAIGQFVPPGTKRFATDSAKQVHYLPAIMGVEGRFGTTEACVRTALTGRWAA